MMFDVSVSSSNNNNYYRIPSFNLNSLMDGQVKLDDEKRQPKANQFNFGKCKVCKDRATGIHYGIASCEGCKGFFKRSIEKNEKYVCYYGYKCVITPKQRKRCKYCRWRSCLEAGMSFEGIKMGRIPKIEKERNKYSSEDSSNDGLDNFEMDDDLDSQAQSTNRLESLKLSLQSILNLNPSLGVFSSIDPYSILPRTSFTDLCIKSSNENNIFILTLIKDKCYQLYRENTSDYRCQYERAIKLIENGINCDIFRFNQKFEDIWKSFCILVSNFTRSLVRTINQLPGFEKFELRDVAHLVNERLFAAFGLYTTRLFINKECYLMMDGNIQLSRHWMNILFKHEASEKIFNYHSKLNSFNLTDCELAILIPWILCSQDLDISNKDLLRELRMYYTQVLIYELNLNQRGPDFFNYLSQCLAITSDINRMCKSACHDVK